MATTTPWGPSQHSEKLAPGIMRYSTAGHGGVRVCKTRNAQVHPAWRIESGWYEEDLDWAIVAYYFPDAFPTVDGNRVKAMLKSWYPHQYMAATGETVTPEESFKLREEASREANKDNIVTVAAVGAWHDNVSPGMVGVTACKGGRLANGHYADPANMRYFLVPKEEYDARGEHPFVVDPERHQEIASL